MADLQFPWEAFMQAQENKNKNKQQLAQILGQTLGNIGQDVGQGIQNHRLAQQQQQQKQQLQGLRDALGQMGQSQPQTVNFGGQNAPTASYNPATNQTTPNMTQPDPRMKSITDLISKLPDQQLGQGVADFTQQISKGAFGQQKPQASVFVNPQDATQVSPTPVPGWKEYKTSQGDALSKVTGAAQSKAKNAAARSRAEAMQRGIDTKQIDHLTQTIGFTPKMISSIQQTATRAQRGLDIISQPNVTWQQLNAAGVDFAGIMQGGAPHVGEVVNSTFPNWHQNAAKWQTYIDGNNPSNVPEPIRKQMQSMISGVFDIDKKFIDSSNKFNIRMIGPTIRGGLNQNQNSAIQDIQKSMIGGQNSASSPKATLRWNPQTQSLEPVQ